MNTMSVRWVLKMLTPNCRQVSEELLKWYRRDPAKIYLTTGYSGWNIASTTSILCQNNKACNGMNESVKIVISLQCVILFFSMTNANNRRLLKCTKYL